ncbi:hypothetical protein FITA111629_11605 [Filibacter tadaridae]|uniref:Uncharacterized protein n=1 Tax=Filibacter tadaridae TaxID=2483811 RepID=A0A3P5X1G4_9BACL|nr:hypothetical protein [Filibacter tadaridae]VDC21044.1 hypothetical protein FILTAD_00518 [Filibacter tadaridae]
MTIKDGKYPNKEDLEPKVAHPNGRMTPTDELPLADPSDSNSTDTFRDNAQDKKGEHKPSAYNENKKNVKPSTNNPKLSGNIPSREREQSNQEFNVQAHSEWNEHKVKK